MAQAAYWRPIGRILLAVLAFFTFSACGAARQGLPLSAAPAGAQATGATGATAGTQEALPATRPRLRLLGHSDLGGNGLHANVAALGRYAYVGSTSFSDDCPGEGVAIVDLADPAAPTVVARAAQIPGTTAEHVVALRVHTPFFRGDLLGVGIQRCSDHSRAAGQRQAGAQRLAGLAVVDVTDPRRPRELSFFPSGPSVHGVHELDLVQREDGQVLALLAVTGSERQGQGDFQIVDLTNPRRPVHLSSWGAGTDLGIDEGASCQPSVVGHSARAGAGGQRAYVSYWDAGVFILDISVPAAPRAIGRIWDPEADGASHSVDEAAGNLLLITEEIGLGFGPRRLTARAEAGGRSFEFQGCETPSQAPLRSVGTLKGPLAYAGTACQALPAPLPGAIVLVDAGGCRLAEKGDRLAQANASAMLVIQPGGQDGRPVSPGGAPAGALRITTVGISRADAERLALLARAGPVTVTLPVAREWGALRIWDVSDPASPRRLAVFHTENSARFPPPDSGWYTVHNALAIGARYVLLAWYSDGVRLVDIGDPRNPREVASFRPPSRPDASRSVPTSPAEQPRALEAAPGIPVQGMIWGVARTGNLVLASDIGTGLYILRLEGIPLPG
jgi:hypothetical protein